MSAESQSRVEKFLSGINAAWPDLSQSLENLFWPLCLAFVLSLAPVFVRLLRVLAGTVAVARVQLVDPSKADWAKVNELWCAVNAAEFLEYFFFVLFGIIVAYIEVRIGGLLVEGVLPSVLTVVTVLVQLVGRSVPSMEPPLDKRRSLANASLVCLGFLICFEYFEVSKPQPKSDATASASEE